MAITMSVIAMNNHVTQMYKVVVVEASREFFDSNMPLLIFIAERKDPKVWDELRQGNARIVFDQHILA